jgi:hypothetical protein
VIAGDDLSVWFKILDRSHRLFHCTFVQVASCKNSPSVNTDGGSTESLKRGDGDLLPALDPVKQSLTGDGDMVSRHLQDLRCPFLEFLV